MPRRISIAPHLSTEELGRADHQAQEGLESRQYQIIWLLAKGKTTEEVQEITGYSRIWIYELVKRYNQLGLKGLGARRKGNPGHPPLIDDVTQAQLWQALQGTAPDGGLWNGRQVADWLTGVTGRKISRQRGWEILRQMTFRLRVPRPAHIESDEDEQQAWKKKLVTELEGLRRRYPDAQVQLWSEDEHRLGLKPVMRRIYVAEDCQPLAHINWKFEWLWLYGFVRPETGETYWWIIPYVNTTLFSRVLQEFAAEFKLGPNQHIMLVVDQAGWHISKNLKVPEGLHLMFLPSHSPELQPAERLWPLVDEPIANRSFENLDQLEELLCARCRSLWKQRELIRGLTSFHWWHQTETLL
ncbi:MULTISPECIES: IS630-like element ISAtsp4 family transposase [Limnospira]|nr:IS630-like element ISAtsp4 family transposase [Limnospira maxima]EDZ93287.1 conserved hypothetical protein [Limnospira maxima CS-328]EKD06392.1 hypothetical protein SPLC1_S543370 [Arthrospira platensis C1]QJB26895.1 IS630-like element ISAtsp4 family transposase [Limnospira fusiformis SAG 85.79]